MWGGGRAMWREGEQCGERESNVGERSGGVELNFLFYTDSLTVVLLSNQYLAIAQWESDW